MSGLRKDPLGQRGTARAVANSMEGREEGEVPTISAAGAASTGQGL